MDMVIANSLGKAEETSATSWFPECRKHRMDSLPANVSCFASVQRSSGEGGSPVPGSGWLLHSWWGNEKSWSERNENMCIGRLPLLNVPHHPGGQMAFYVVFTTVILDWLLNLFVFLTQLPASCLAFSLTRILRAEFEQLHYYFFLFLITVVLVPASTTWSRPICLPGI